MSGATHTETSTGETRSVGMKSGERGTRMFSRAFTLAFAIGVLAVFTALVLNQGTALAFTDLPR